MLVDDHIVEERHSVWQKKKVRTIVVNSRSRVSSRRSIAGALAIAKPYDRIELLGGEYFETISINIPLEIVAAEGEDPCIVSRGTCLTFTQDVEAYFEHIEFISKGRGKLEASVALMNGRSVFFKCKMNSILIGGFSKPHIEHCTIAESFNGYGIQISDSAGAEIQNCTIHTHHVSCAEIDTKGTVILRDSTLRQPSNGGNVIVVRALQSSSGDHTQLDSLSCRKVTITKCHIYVTSDIFKAKDRDWFADGVIGQPSCVVISRGASPIFTYNEILQGFIGFTFEYAGSAILEGNCIYNQKNCGILAIVDEKSYSSDSREQNLRISGSNLIDRCLIGVDVHCSRKSMIPTSIDQENFVSQELPSCRTSFNWIEKLHKKEEGEYILSNNNSTNNNDNDEDSNKSVRVFGKNIKLEKLKEHLRTLAKLVCAGHPSHFRKKISSDSRRETGGLTLLGELLQETLSISVTPLHTFDSATQLLKIRGNRGVDILDTRFSACGLCAIRFGSDGYGLVENCDFIKCGATAIVVGTGAHPLIVGCKFDQSKGAGIFVDNFANPLIIGNEISSNIEHGLEFRNMSFGIVIGNSIIGNNKSGILVAGGSNTIIAGNSLNQNILTGITVSENSKPVIIMNKFISNRSSQLLIMDYSTPFISNNNVFTGSGNGIHFKSCSGGTVFDNTITSNETGILVELDADPYIISNKILNSQRHGIIVSNNGLGTFLLNEISQSGSCNFVIQEGGSPVVRKNIIRQGHSGGVAVFAEGAGTIEYNLITENAMGNIIVLDLFSEPIFTKNIVSCSFSGAGIVCGRECSGKFIQNHIFQNKQCGIYVIGNANPFIFKNVISNETIGIIISDNGRGIFKENDINSSYGTGVIIQLDGDPTFQNNNISKCFLSGLLVAPEGRGTISENKFFENDVGIQLGSTLGTAELDLELSFISTSSNTSPGNEKNTPIKPRRSLFDKRRSTFQSSQLKETPAQIYQNKIYANITCGVLLESEASGILEDNEIESNDMYGVLADIGYSAKRAQTKLGKKPGHSGWKLPHVTSGGGSAIIRKNRIFNHKRSNISIMDHNDNNISISFNDIYESQNGIYVGNNSNIFIFDTNKIHNCFDGIYTDSGGCSNFENNFIYDCSGVGIYVCDRANPKFTKSNIIEKCYAGGVFIDAGGKGLFSETIMRHCIVGVIVYACVPISSVVLIEDFVQNGFVTSAPIFEHCIIEQNSLHGILVLTVPNGYSLRYFSNDALKRSQKIEGLINTPGISVFPQFRQNNIRDNRHFGICHEFYDNSESSEQERINNNNNNNSISPSDTPSKRKRGLNHSHLNHHPTHRRISALSRSRFAHRNSLQEALGTSFILKSDEHHQERMRRQVSFIGNIITNCSIGVVVGGGCHPFFLKNKIHNNAFFGMLFRSHAKAMCFGCEIADNGIAGIYAAKGSLGSFSSGIIRRNNGFSRPEGNPHESRSFDKLPFMQSVIPLQRSIFIKYQDSSQDAYIKMLQMLKEYADIVADGIHVLCEVVCASFTGLSLASGTFPTVSLESNNISSNNKISASGLMLDAYDKGWATDGGFGAWIVQGSMIEISDNIIELNRNFGIFYSRDVQQHHQNLSHFYITPTDGFPIIPGSEVISGEVRSPLDENTKWLFFSSTAISRNHIQEGGKKLMFSSFVNEVMNNHHHSSNSSSNINDGSKTPPQITLYSPGRTETPETDADSPFLLIRPATISGNHITKNGSGVFMHLHHVMKAKLPEKVENTNSPQTSTKQGGGNNNNNRKISLTRKPVRRPTVRSTSISLKDTKSRKRLSSIKQDKSNEDSKDNDHENENNNNISVAPFTENLADSYIKVLTNAELSELEFSIKLEENHIYLNIGIGVICQHIVEILCGHMMASRLEFDKVMKEYNDVCIKMTLKKELIKPKLLFFLVPHERMTRYAKISGNEIYKNKFEQLEVTSRYVVISQDKVRTLLQFDTMREPNASMCSSQALLRTSLFASLIMTAPPGMFLIENNRFRDSSKGIHIIGFVGTNSCCLRHNAFLNITNSSILIEGHLASATIGNGNIFESNDIAIRIIMPEENITEEDKVKQLSMGVYTQIYANRFNSPKYISVFIEGGGAVPPTFIENEFSNHLSGSVAFFISGSTVTANITKNIFQENYIPVIITNKAGSSEGCENNVIIEKNRFSKNYIGLLICGGSAPKVMQNLFEENYRSGLEIAEEGTKPIIRYCIFAFNKRKELSNISSNKEIFIYPDNGELQIQGIIKFSIKISSNNNALINREGINNNNNNNIENFLPAGVLINSEGGGLLEQCLFKENDIGVDVVRDNNSINSKWSPPGICFTSCLFTENIVAGVWVRGNLALNVKSSSSLRTLENNNNNSDVEATIFEGCFFANNKTDADGKGDVVATDGGIAIFRNNLFTGSIHGNKDGMTLFERNTFISSPTIDVAVYLHKSTRIRLLGNTIRGHKTAIITESGAWGKLESNWILDTNRCVISAPFCHTLFSANRMIKAKDCGVLAFGGIFAENEICNCPTGVVIQNPIEYKNYHLIPAIEKTAFDALFTENKIHTCEGDGIFLAGGARIEGNIIFNCKTNLNIICPKSIGNGSAIATVSRNYIFDGEIGILAVKGSESVIRDNDVFDNSMVGVWLKYGASGTLQGNSISSSLKDGALEVEEGCQIKVLHNTTRNQFSPSYQKTLPTHREKERRRAAEILSQDLQEVDKSINQLVENCNRITTSMLTILESLQEESGISDSLGSLALGSMAGAASKALRNCLLEVNTVDSLGLNITKTLRRYSTDRVMSITAVKATKSVDRRMSLSNTIPSQKNYKHVLIHVFSENQGGLDGTTVGKKIENSLMSSSLASKVMFRTTLTNNSSGLAASLTAQRPDILIVIVETGKDSLNAEEAKALASLDRWRRSSQSQLPNITNNNNNSNSNSNYNDPQSPTSPLPPPAPTSSLSSAAFTLLPQSWKFKIESRNSNNSDNSDKSQFALAQNPIYYNDNPLEAFAEVLRELQLKYAPSIVPILDAPAGEIEEEEEEEEISIIKRKKENETSKGKSISGNKGEYIVEATGRTGSISFQIPVESTAQSQISPRRTSMKVPRKKSQLQQNQRATSLKSYISSRGNSTSGSLPKMKTPRGSVAK